MLGVGGGGVGSNANITYVGDCVNASWVPRAVSSTFIRRLSVVLLRSSFVHTSTLPRHKLGGRFKMSRRCPLHPPTNLIILVTKRRFGQRGKADKGRRRGYKRQRTKGDSLAEDSRATGGLVFNLSRLRVESNKAAHTPSFDARPGWGCGEEKNTRAWAGMGDGRSRGSFRRRVDAGEIWRRGTVLLMRRLDYLRVSVCVKDVQGKTPRSMASHPRFTRAVVE